MPSAHGSRYINDQESRACVASMFDGAAPLAPTLEQVPYRILRRNQPTAAWYAYVPLQVILGSLKLFAADVAEVMFSHLYLTAS